MVRFSKTVKVEPQAVTPKKGRPVGSKNKVRKITSVESEKHIDYGTYDYFDQQDLTVRKCRLRISKDGNMGVYNLRIEIETDMLNESGENEILLLQAPYATFLRKRNDEWRKNNGSVNQYSAVKVEEIVGYEEENGESNLEEIWCSKKSDD